MSAEAQSPELTMDPEALYQEEVFTDRQIGTIRRLSPVNRDGAPDTARPVLYVGQTQIMTPMGQLPLSFELDASSLGEAAEQFGPAAEKAVEQAKEELQELRREAASQIVTPDQGGGNVGGPGGMPGGGGGKLHMP